MVSNGFTPIVVTTTSDERSVLEKISYQLIESQVAACVQISGPITSYYRWEGKIETSEEWVCLIKTCQERFNELQATVMEQHNYDEPQLIALPITAGSQGYLEWMKNGLTTLR